MKKLLGTTAIGLALAATPALASDTDSNQYLNAPQLMPNLLDVGGDVTDKTQSATNSANVEDWIDGNDGDFDDINQVVNGGGSPGNEVDIQKAINRILVDDETLLSPNEQKLENVTQDAINNANYVNIDDIDNANGGGIVQKFNNGYDNQVARNVIRGDNDAPLLGDPGRAQDNELELKNVEQTAANYANSIYADDFKTGGDANTFQQALANSTDQTATNTAWFELRAESVDQYAGNYGNIADVNGVDTTVEQTTGNLVDQEARNTLFREPADNDGTGSVIHSGQDAVNMANIFTSEIVTNNNPNKVPDQDKNNNDTPDPEVERIHQTGGDSQRATNRLTFGDKLGLDNGKKNKPDTYQTASNVMNMASVESFVSDVNALNGGASGNLVDQHAKGVGSQGEPSEQLARNYAAFEGQSFGLNVEAGNVTDFEQTASNAANLAYAGTLPSFGGVTEFQQIMDLPQTGGNTLITPGSVSNSAQIGSNVANVVGQKN
jgi:hypothetical protein